MAKYLKGAEYIKVMEALNKNHDLLQHSGKLRSEVCELIHAVCGIELSVHQASKVIKEAGIELHQPKPDPQPEPDPQPDMVGGQDEARILRFKKIESDIRGIYAVLQRIIDNQVAVARGEPIPYTSCAGKKYVR